VLFSPTSGRLRAPRSRAAAFGLWYATREPSQALRDAALANAASGGTRVFASPSDVEAAVGHGALSLHAAIRVRVDDGAPVESSAGRVLCFRVLRRRLSFALINRALHIEARARLVEVAADLLGVDAALEVEDDLDRFGLGVAARSGASLASCDLRAPTEKPEILAASFDSLAKAEAAYKSGDLTSGELYNRIVEGWTAATEDVHGAVERDARPERALGAILASGLASSGEANRCVGMVGPVFKPYGEAEGVRRRAQPGRWAHASRALPHVAHAADRCRKSLIPRDRGRGASPLPRRRPRRRARDRGGLRRDARAALGLLGERTTHCRTPSRPCPRSHDDRGRLADCKRRTHRRGGEHDRVRRGDTHS
jgi:hypothetical protein